MRSRFGDLPLSWKLLLPSIGLIVVLGIVGGYLIVRDLSARSQAALDLELSRRALDARSTIRDAELSLIESANFASNIQGIATAVSRHDTATVAKLLESVIALKTDLESLSATDRRGTTLVAFERRSAGAPPAPAEAGRVWRDQSVRDALESSTGNKHVGVTTLGGRAVLLIAAPFCSSSETCHPTGVAIVGIGLNRLAQQALTRNGAEPRADAGLTVFDPAGRSMAKAGTLAPGRLASTTTAPRGIRGRSGSVDVATLYVPFELDGIHFGTLGVSVPIAPTLSSVRRTGLGLGLILLAAMGGIALIGVLLSRITVRRMRTLIETNRALGRGDLGARAHVEWNDEIGELGTRLNEMAEQLQAMYETLEMRVAQRTEEVERLLRERTEFFASVSHELRTPLAVILRHAEMLLDDAYRKNTRWKLEAGTALKDSGGQLAQLIDDILQLAEVEAGGMDVSLEPVDVAACLRELRGTIEPLARASGLRAKIAAAGDLWALADKRRLRQIIINLVDNAVKYTPEGGSVEVSCAALGEHVAVSVSDTGLGIPTRAGDRIFEPFFRVKGTETQQGQSSSGLGLAVAKRLVEAHGGTIHYAPKADGGTTFTFTLLPADQQPTLTGSAANGHTRND